LRLKINGSNHPETSECLQTKIGDRTTKPPSISLSVSTHSPASKYVRKKILQPNSLALQPNGAFKIKLLTSEKKGKFVVLSIVAHGKLFMTSKQKLHLK
jgi:hypothetical protein